MSDLRDAAQQALEALEFMADEWGFTQKANRPERWQAITALKAALEQPEQEPELRELLIGAAAMAVAAERKGEYQGASWVAEAVLEQQGKEKPRSATSHIGTYYGRKNPALEQPEQPEQPVQEPAKRATGWVAPKDHYTTPVFFNPYTGDPRDVRDVRSDPQGILIVPPGAAWLTAKG